MTEREAKIERARCDLRAASIRLQEKKEKMDRGIVEAQAVFDAKAAQLKSEWLQAQVDCEREQIYLREAEDIVGPSV